MIRNQRLFSVHTNGRSVKIPTATKQIAKLRLDRKRHVFIFIQTSNFERLFHVQLSFVTVLVLSAVIVYAIGKVAILLNFANDAARTDGVDRTRRNEITFPCLDLEEIQKLRLCVILEKTMKVATCQFMHWLKYLVLVRYQSFIKICLIRIKRL